jgi:hypothetical protein
VIFIKAHDIPIARVALFKISHTILPVSQLKINMAGPYCSTAHTCGKVFS